MSKYGIEDTGVWLETLKDLTPRALESGIEALKRGVTGDEFIKYPPNAMEFRALCLGFYEGLRLPTAPHAYSELKKYIRMGKWDDAPRIIKYTALKLGEHFSFERDVDAYPVFKKTYDKVCHVARLGIEIPDVKDMVYFLPKQSSQQIARAHLIQLKQYLGVRV